MPRSTLQEIIQDGRLAPGMAAVVRRDPDAVRGLHVFIYEHSSIQNWQAGKSLLKLDFTNLYNTGTRLQGEWPIERPCCNPSRLPHVSLCVLEAVRSFVSLQILKTLKDATNVYK